MTDTLKIKMLSPRSIKPNPDNARKHPAGQVDMIAESIRKFGFLNPVLIDEHKVLIAGEGRWHAARQMQLRSIPTITVPGLTEAQRTELALADNSIALNSAWDNEKLIQALDSMTSAGADCGYLGISLEALLPATDAERPVDEDVEPPPPAKPTTKLGDVWIAGNHLLVCGDCTDEGAVDAVLGRGGKAEMAFTDPPYGVSYVGKSKKLAEKTFEYESVDSDEYRSFLHTSLGLMAHRVRGAMFVCIGEKGLCTTINAMRLAGARYRGMILWIKNRQVLGRADLQFQHESIVVGEHETDAGPDGRALPVVYFRPQGGTFNGERKTSSVWFFSSPAKQLDYPTAKPLALVERAIKLCSNLGATVLDSFGGSGTTMLAAENTKRCARLIEISPGYCDVILNRWRDLTGNEPVRKRDGKTFGEAQDAARA